MIILKNCFNWNKIKNIFMFVKLTNFVRYYGKIGIFAHDDYTRLPLVFYGKLKEQKILNEFKSTSGVEPKLAVGTGGLAFGGFPELKAYSYLRLVTATQAAARSVTALLKS